MKNGVSRRLIALAAAGTMLLSVAACGSSSDGNASSDSGSASLISVNNSEPQNGLIPTDTNEMGGGKVIRYLFEGLVSFDAKGKQHLEVAESITPNDDATKYTIKLKKGWKFTNGEAVTAKSFADAWSFAANVKNAQKTASRFSTIKGYDELQDSNVDPKATLSGLSTPDDYTLVVELNKPDSVFPTKLAHQSYFPLPSVAFQDIKKFGQAPIGNGPYKFKSWAHNKNIIIVPNKDYKGSRKVANNGIEYRVYTDEDSAYSDVLSSNLDVLDEVPQSAVKTFRKDSGVIAYSQAGSTFEAFVIPERLEHFGDDEEGHLRRQAISMAINRDQIVKKVYDDTKTATTDFTSPLVPEYAKNLKNGDNLKYNADKAKELWEKANAIKPWSGNFRIAYNADGGHKEWVDAVCNQIKNTLGIDAAGDPYATFSDVRKRVTDRSITTAFRSGWMLDYPSAEDYLNPLYASSSADGHGSNDGDYKSEEFDNLLNAALAQTDVQKRTDDFTEAQEVLAKDLPVIPLWYDNVAAVSATNVKNVSFDYTNLPTYNTITK
ncbi:peptide ABC transporter substrate-binding protein [Bifidobacterium sp.]|uniref:peptide ABC transporter substrate-binding protein n=1 Tax=Bifidobacterium sp. TaxID=41200 RepID=UPI003D7DC635